MKGRHKLKASRLRVTWMTLKMSRDYIWVYNVCCSLYQRNS